ncbi:GNAT family N-acetyltransferase [Stenotrophomonas sp. 24(2023)]|uniref:GNAT family N-acetyltransferase n=1 Tax=Stenotrophomonas sp. 24(2023) TaxID=3068324 RepID=UPI0027DF1103|nr:GNAT family N-acetyltransferase [Stenotrophomonas sp. 24(2023)]WMJ68242.1 GNAT family N-acetyltransferase [Stenotrophomonas sp. 24(2023)]
MLSIPELHTPRLRLRAQALEDFPAYAAFLASPRAAGMGGPFDRVAAWGQFCHDLAGWALFGHGALMIERRSDGCCLGQVGINHGPLFPEKELGWLLYDGHEGHGYASEAAIALRDWAFRAGGLQTLVSYMAPDNLASQAVARRLGGVLDPQAARSDPQDLAFRYRRAAAGT